MDNQTQYQAELQQYSPEKKFSASKIEAVCAVLTFIASYVYVSDIENGPRLAIVACALIAVTELLNLGRKATGESFVWLACFAMCTVSGIAELSQTWYSGQVMLFIHIFAVWWIMARSGKLLEGKSGHLLPADALNAFVIIPFSHFFMWLRCPAYNIGQLCRKKSGEKRKMNFWLIPAALICLVLFARAISLLTAADERFGDCLKSLTELFSFKIDGYQILLLILSCPVCSWLFGLMDGTVRFPQDKLDRQRGSICSTLNEIRKVPMIFWVCTVGLFSLLYLGFFILQGSYLFGAFTHTLPEGFIVSQYAREGFFELCRVMAVNFTVLWLVTRMASEEACRSRAFKAVCLILLLESMLFAIIAFSKLCMYISCFGFTPKRLQSTWLVCVLFAGCLFWGWTLLTDRPVFRKWMYFGAVSLSILTLF